MSEYLSGKQPTTEQLNQWIEYFHANGFLVIENVLTPEQCEVLKNDLDEILKQSEGKNYQKSKKIMKRMFEHSQQNLNLFALEPMVTFAEHLIGGANGTGYLMHDGIPNANIIHVIHNNSFKIPPETDGLAKNAWHQDDTPHALSLDGKPLTNIRLNVLAFTVNYYLTDVLTQENGPTQVIPGSHLFGKLCDGNISGYEDQIYSCLGGMGSAVCFNNQVWHRGSRNSSSITRYITQITYAKRLVGHKYAPFMNYQMPSHCYEQADPKLKQLLGFLPNGAYG
ncbi:mitomycin antibiotics/polyketide fumonisin biosynthesis protein [Nostoc linckia z18]|jgi:ectoine hydroxylase-related dioxygenase (phytanoyl-CoA dioxygenase family)|uniref:Mitomycin antibiotics/polyketide fumonisin biosynthesis protein n=3 Tax=Nostoc TaxID=1177 RepID=A0A9Q5Z7L9_NOSLI|nr:MULTISPECIES: phytanoyl-CoA dioxygenase family protein [Nostoc]MBL1203689.1 phytanoyl-CoA dioxygenase family protein [Nostoc sp. GBBB01]PHK35184.1 mitomycin antibiotics/polyketide fumonisin biosynthesis protein [Nostoc linckia z15]PHK43387.1 mitomycin antibiotics/polyketide fumonisin biosynthesis protein [Nostoc linckia z16]MBD2611412.1 phytanoyl-CoA dioxygenase family protein [Nostoc punctiforme FACHB-252]PHJ57391.1 mitomycin antibiotics/polyketide fumonisin biosynthesis protein [Nostoc li